MKALNNARRAVSAVFISTVFVYLFLNIRVRHFDLMYGIGIIEPPSSVYEYGVKAREIDYALRDYTFMREPLINLSSLAHTALGKEENGGFDIVRSREGYLNYGDFYNEIPKALEEYAMRVRRLKDSAGDGCKVIFVNVPPMYAEGYHTYSAGLPFQNENNLMDALLFYLQGFGVDYVDMRPEIRASGLAPAKYRYKTDSHWTIEASFEGFRALVRTLEDEYGESIDPDGLYTSPGSYISIRYPEKMAGSLAARAGLPFSGREDFTMLLPDFPTAFTHERNDGGNITLKSGEFSDSLIDSDYLLTDNLYMSYLGGLAPFRRIINNNNADGLRVLFLSDSFSLPLAAFLSLASAEVDMIYTPSRQVFGYSIDADEYLSQNAAGYDYIFVQLSPGSYNENGFSFFAR